MIDYSISILSFSPQEPGFIVKAINCAKMQDMIFPAKLYNAPGKSIFLAKSADFKIPMVPEELKTPDGSHIHVELFGEKGITFSGDTYLSGGLPSAISMDFNSNHFDMGIVSITDLKSLIRELVDALQPDYISIYDKHLVKIPLKSGGYRFEPNKFHQIDRKGFYYPLDIEWFTYFGPKMLDILGRERFSWLSTCAEKSEVDGGIMIMLQEEPFEMTNSDHRTRRGQAERELKLSELVTLET